MFFAYYHAALGRRERALAEGRRATEDTPLFGLIQAAYALVQIFCGQVEEGVEQARRALTIEPGNAVALKELWFANVLLGRYDEALNALAPLAPAFGLPPDALSRLRAAHEVGGTRAFAVHGFQNQFNPLFLQQNTFAALLALVGVAFCLFGERFLVTTRPLAACDFSGAIQMLVFLLFGGALLTAFSSSEIPFLYFQF